MNLVSGYFYANYFKSTGNTFLCNTGFYFSPRRCKEEACHYSKESDILLFFSGNNLDKITVSFNEYAKLIGLAAIATLEPCFDKFERTNNTVIALSNTSNKLEREAAAMVIRTICEGELYKEPVSLDKLFTGNRYFLYNNLVQNVFSNWKAFISGVTEAQLEQCVYNFNGLRHGGLINWIEDDIFDLTF